MNKLYNITLIITLIIVVVAIAINSIYLIHIKSKEKKWKRWNRNIAIICPTMHRATIEWEKFVKRWSSIIVKVNNANLYVELLTGHKVYFIGEGEKDRKLLGFHGDVTMIDEFEDLMESEEMNV